MKFKTVVIEDDFVPTIGRPKISFEDAQIGGGSSLETGELSSMMRQGKGRSITRRKMRWRGIKDELDYRWRRKIAPMEARLMESTTNETVKDWVTKKKREERKRKHMLRPPLPDWMNAWNTADRKELSKATLPSNWRVKPTTHALPRTLRRKMKFTDSTREDGNGRRRKPRPASARPASVRSEKAKKEKQQRKSRPMSAATTRQKKEEIGAVEELQTSTGGVMSIDRNNGFIKFCDALSGFSEITYYHPKSSIPLIEELLVAADELNSEGNTKTIFEQVRVRVGGMTEKGSASKTDNKYRPQSALQRKRHKGEKGDKEKCSRKEPWHGGKPGTYVSPVLLHTMKKEEKAKGAAIVAIWKNGKRGVVSASTRRRVDNYERPWSAPARKQKPRATTVEVTKLRVDLEGLGVNVKGTLKLMTDLVGALKCSSNARVLPFSLQLKVEGGLIEKTVESEGKVAALLLKQLLLHPGVEKVDFGFSAKKTVNQGPTLAINESMQYTLDFEEDDEPELLQALHKSGRDSPTLRAIENAIEAREKERAISPPLEEVLYEGVSVLKSTRNILDLGNQTTRKKRHSYFKSGYLMERPRAASLIDNQDEDLPLFKDLAIEPSGVVDNEKERKEESKKKATMVARETEKNEEDEEDDKEWESNIIFKSSYVMRRTANF